MVTHANPVVKLYTSTPSTRPTPPDGAISLVRPPPALEAIPVVVGLTSWANIPISDIPKTSQLFPTCRWKKHYCGWPHENLKKIPRWRSNWHLTATPRYSVDVFEGMTWLKDPHRDNPKIGGWYECVYLSHLHAFILTIHEIAIKSTKCNKQQKNVPLLSWFILIHYVLIYIYI